MNNNERKMKVLARINLQIVFALVHSHSNGCKKYIYCNQPVHLYLFINFVIVL